MRRTVMALAMLAVMSLACEDATGPTGPVKLAIVDGDGQLVEAGRDSLTEAVVARAVRGEDGGVSFLIGPKALLAQGTQTGVANIRTCARNLETPGLVPWVDCLDTDSEGFVNYWFEPPTVAGEHCAEIRGVVDGQPEVVATTCSTVEPGPAVVDPDQDGVPGLRFPSGVSDTLLAVAWTDAYGNSTRAFTVAPAREAWLTTVPGDGQRLAVLESPQIGDTISLVYRHLDGSVLAEAIGEVGPWGQSSWEIIAWKPGHYQP